MKRIQSSREKACAANVFKDLALLWEGRHQKQSRDSEATLESRQSGKRGREQGNEERAPEIMQARNKQNGKV